MLRSLPATTIPRTLPVTLNTANDHIKAISAKTGAGSRGDLMTPHPGSTACRGGSRRPGKVTALSARPGPSRTHPVIRESGNALTPMTLQRKGDRMAGSERHQQDSSGHQPEYRSAGTCALGQASIRH